MSTKAAIDDTPAEADERWPSLPEAAPSAVAAEEPMLPRVVGGFGLASILLGGSAILLNRAEVATRIGTGFGSFLIVLGFAALLFHALREKDVQFRRFYGVLGCAFLIAAVITSICPAKEAAEKMVDPVAQAATGKAAYHAGAMFVQYGFPCFILALMFLIPFARNEDDETYQKATQALLGIVGGVQSVVGIGLLVMIALKLQSIAGFYNAEFLRGVGLLLALLGFTFLWAFLGLKGAETEVGYKVGTALAALGFAVFTFAIGRWLLPQIGLVLGWFKTIDANYLPDSGVLLMVLGVLYLGLALGFCSNWHVVVLTRRELAATFYSPIFHLALFGFTILAGFQYLYFSLVIIASSSQQGNALPEPIIAHFIMAWIPVLWMLFVVPLLTMRLLSEEKRTATLEVLFTAPVGEVPVVLSKLLAALVFLIACWLPYGAFLLSLRIVGGQPFDYRPILSFGIVLFWSSANFLAMGLFLSSLTRYQIVAAVLTMLGMIAWFLTFILAKLLENLSLPVSPETQEFLQKTFQYLSFVDLWNAALEGKLYLRSLALHVSGTIFWVFLTIKVLEIRKWG